MYCWGLGGSGHETVYYYYSTTIRVPLLISMWSHPSFTCKYNLVPRLHLYFSNSRGQAERGQETRLVQATVQTYYIQSSLFFLWNILHHVHCYKIPIMNGHTCYKWQCTSICSMNIAKQNNERTESYHIQHDMYNRIDWIENHGWTGIYTWT